MTKQPMPETTRPRSPEEDLAFAMASLRASIYAEARAVPTPTERRSAEWNVKALRKAGWRILREVGK